ncbi:MAG: transposase [Anaerovoracaceae bacterium]
MNYILGEERAQITLLPASIDEYVAEDNPVRVVDAFVDSLDMEALGFQRAKPNLTGRPSYNPRDLLKLYIYGYFNKIRSSRCLMRECTRNIELMYLLAKLVPDFRTIADFRKNNPKAIKNVFKEFVRLCVELDLYQREIIAIDGSKFRASNSDKNCYNKEVLDKKIAHIERRMTEYLSYLDKEDRSEVDFNKSKNQRVKEAIAELTERRQKYLNFKKELSQTGESQLLTTDPEARRMYSKDGFHCSYNAQTAVDAGSHLIAAYLVDSKTDVGHLQEVSKEAMKNLSVDTIETLADKGYDSQSDVFNCLMSGIVANPAIKEDMEERIFNIEYIENEIHEELRNSTNPSDIKKCLHAAVLPKCYEGKNVTVEYQGQNDSILSCFTRSEDEKTVTCPMGEVLRFTKTKRNQKFYKSQLACRFCSNKCTKSKFKEVSFGPGKKYVPVRMNKCKSQKLPLMPSDLPLPNNFKKSSHSKVLIRITHTTNMTTNRMCLSEHPFGSVKWHNLSYFLLCRGKEKVSAEIGLAFLAYNLRRAINMLGVKAIISAL